MAWVAGADVTTGDLITAAQWNNYMGVAGSLEYLKATAIQSDGSVAFGANQDMAGFILTGLGAGAAAGQSARFEQLPKELWSPATLAGGGGVLTAYHEYPVAVLTGAAEKAYMGFRCPVDFTAFVIAKIIVIPRATKAAADWDTAVGFAQEGEDKDINDASEAAATYNVTDDQLFGVDVSGILAAMTAGDNAGLQLTQTGALDNVDVLGFYMTYT